MSSKNTGNNHGVEVLIAEDSLTQAEQLRHLLEEHGFSVRAVSNGTEALAAARERRPTVIISDIVMPEMDGYDLCKAVKSDEVLKDTPVVLLTSLSSPQDVIEALKSGADNFIRKPYDERHLLLRVEHIIANRRLRESDKVKVGVELYLGGERHFITAERQQILDLLISTYEQAVQLCRELQMREEELDRANTMLTGIYRIAKGLNSAATESEIVEQVLRNALDLPDVRAGWISLFDPASGFQLVGSRGLPPALAQPGVIEGDCLCRQKFLEGDIIRATNITECERLQKAKGETLGLRSHVTIPLHVGTRPLGILNLVGSEQVMFSENDLTILNGIGNQIGVALERCRMHEHLEERVRQRTAALTAEIAERARAEDALRTTEAQLIQAQKMESIGSLAGGIAHDFNNILGIILGHASIIQGSSGGVENVFPSIDAINRSVVRGAGLVRQLLTFARKTEKTIETVRLNDLIEELIKMLTETFPKTITIARYLDADLPPIGADANQLHQVLLNLAVNGRDAMPDGGTLSFHTRVLTGDELRHRFPDAEHNAYVSVHVSDTGVGMDTETQRRIFEPFFTTKGPGKGTGLGMSVVYGVVTGHDGLLDFESAPAKGTTFYLYFPLGQAEKTDSEEKRENARLVTSGTETILVVEDEEMLRELVRLLLTTKGYNVLTANDGIEAIATYEARHKEIALVLTDMGLPRLDGRGLFNGLRKLNPNVKVIVASGYFEQREKEALRMAGVEEFVQKPYEPNGLLRKIRDVLDRQP